MMKRLQSRLYGPNRLRLGVFATNCSSGLAATRVAERWEPTWENNAAVARMADDAGIEFMLPIARWRGFGGASRFQEDSLETITWASGLLAATKTLTVFGTVHVPLIHPIVAAKQLVTIDQMSRGRLGLNVVCGWNADEFEMFGQAPLDHDARYAYGQDWLNIVLKIWGDTEPFDYDSGFFKLKGVRGSPKPWAGSRPVLMNAAVSGIGREFGVRNSDFLFTILVDLEKGRQDLRDIQTLAASSGRQSVDVLTTSYVVCRPTDREAEEYHHHYAVEYADHDAVDRLIMLQGRGTRGRPLEPKYRQRYAGGHGSFPVVGSPDRVAEQLRQISEAGFAGTTLGFVDYLTELPYFVEQVLPRLERMGLRVPVSNAH